MKKITLLLISLLGLNIYSQDVLWSSDCEDYATANFLVIDNDQDGYNFTPINYGDENGPTDVKFYSESYRNDVGVLYPDNWLFSPEMTIPINTESVTLSIEVFAQMTESPLEYFSIGLYDLNASSGYIFHSQRLNMFQGGQNSADIVTKTINSSERDFSGQNLRMFVRHHNCNGQFWLVVDNFSVSTTGSLSNTEISLSDLKLYPNPTNGLITISNIALGDIKNITVTNQLGQMVKEINPSEFNNNTFDISNLNKGIYFIQIRDVSNNSKTLRIVKN